MRRLAFALLNVSFVLTACGTEPRLERAISTIERDSNFSTGTEGGEALARVTRLLRDEGEACASKANSTAPRCEALFAATGYTQVLAVSILRCTSPDRTTARRALLRYLRDVGRVGESDTLPAPPPLPACGQASS